MKILHIILGLGKGGAELLLVNTLPKYVEMGFLVDVLQISSRWEFKNYADALKMNGVTVYSLSNGSAKNPRLIFKLRNFLKKHKYHIVHVHLFPSLYYTILATRFFRSCPKLIFTEHSSQNRRSAKWFLRSLEKKIYRNYDQVIAVSENIKARLESDLKLKNVTVVKNGIELVSFKDAEPYPKSYWAKTLGINIKATKILMVARFNYPKDHKTALLALAQLPENFVLLLAGDGKGVDKIKAMSVELKLSHRIHFLGFRLDVPHLMKSVDFIILPTKYEGMSGVILEAMASKTCFLGANVVGISEIVPDNRYLFEKGNDKKLAEEIMQLMHQQTLVQEMKTRGFEHVQNFSLDNMLEQHKNIYNSFEHGSA